jgi:hypothetical protein
MNLYLFQVEDQHRNLVAKKFHVKKASFITLRTFTSNYFLNNLLKHCQNITDFMFIRYYGKYVYEYVQISKVHFIHVQIFSSYLTENSDHIRYEDRLVYVDNNSSFYESCEAAYMEKIPSFFINVKQAVNIL